MFWQEFPLKKQPTIRYVQRTALMQHSFTASRDQSASSEATTVFRLKRIFCGASLRPCSWMVLVSSSRPQEDSSSAACITDHTHHHWGRGTGEWVWCPYYFDNVYNLLINISSVQAYRQLIKARHYWGEPERAPH